MSEVLMTLRDSATGRRCFVRFDILDVRGPEGEQYQEIGELQVMGAGDPQATAEFTLDRIATLWPKRRQRLTEAR